MAFCKLAESFWMEQEEKASRDKEHMGSGLLYCSFNAFHGPSEGCRSPQDDNRLETHFATR